MPNCHSLTENFGSRNDNASSGRSIYYGKAMADQLNCTEQKFPKPQVGSWSLPLDTLKNKINK